MALTGEAKKAYQKELMRKRREAQKLVVAERPKEATEEEWKWSQDRAVRAREYAQKMPEHVRPSEQRFWNAEWQWWNEYRKLDKMEYAPARGDYEFLKQRCEKCAGTWNSYTEIECPYCHGHGKRKEAA